MVFVGLLNSWTLAYGILYIQFDITYGQTGISDATKDIEHGTIEGEKLDYGGKVLERYRGIPFAKPPIGSRRFKSPEPQEKWQGTKQTKDFGASCMQERSIIDATIEISEDCLFLNVYAPEGSNLPVMVWIYGGGLTSGTSTTYHGEALAIVGEVIVVTFNYRLSVFGFFADGAESEGNAGFVDQVMALRWVNDNIKEFGGDTSRITIFGESAGGQSVNMHLISPMSKGLFQRAIGMSGAWPGIPLATAEERGANGKILANALGCVPGEQADLSMFECLQSKAAADVLDISTQTYYFRSFPPTIGGEFLPKSPDYYFNTMGTNPDYYVDLMIGLTSDEGLVAMMAEPSVGNKTTMDILTNGITEDDPFYYVLAGYGIAATKAGSSPVDGDPMWDALMNQYIPSEADPFQTMRGLLDIVAHSIFFGPTARTAHIWAASAQKTYLYHFNHIPPMIDSLFKPTPQITLNFLTQSDQLPLRATHGADVPYIFGFMSEALNPNANYYNQTDEEDHQIGRAMMRAWTSFAKTGSPEFELWDGNITAWPEYQAHEEKYWEIKHPIAENSIKSRLLPIADNFFVKFLPQYVKSLETSGTTPPSDSSNIKPGPETPKACVEKRRVSTIDPVEAETALFILSVVVIALLLVTVVIIINYYGLKKEMRKQQMDSRGVISLT